MALLKYCNRNGCNKLVPQGVRYCKAHTVNKTAENRERHKEYDAHCRNQTAKAFYNSSEWKATRARALARDTGIDIYLYITEGRAVPADTVHHIKNDVERIEKALKKIEGKKGYEVIEMRYLQRKKTVENGKQVEEVYTFEEIADILGGQQGYNENLNEKTVRNYKNALVRDMAIFLFGSDAV